MRRRDFVASSLGALAAAAGEAFVGPIPGAAHAQAFRLASLPQPLGELLGAARNGKQHEAFEVAP